VSDGRDRDSAGRARNARPRDDLGRPLPRGAPGVPRQPEGIGRTPDETIDEAQRLLDSGLPFHAHEVLEDAWKAAPDPDKALWKGLAQLAVGLTHAARGNAVGAAALLRRGAQGIEGYAGQDPYRVDVRGLVAWGRAAADRLDDGGTPAAPPALRTAR
jgi:uncharacterized protein